MFTCDTYFNTYHSDALDSARVQALMNADKYIHTLHICTYTYIPIYIYIYIYICIYVCVHFVCITVMRKTVHAFQHFWMLPILSFYWFSSMVSPEILTATQVLYVYMCVDSPMVSRRIFIATQIPYMYVDVYIYMYIHICI